MKRWKIRFFTMATWIGAATCIAVNAFAIEKEPPQVTVETKVVEISRHEDLGFDMNIPERLVYQPAEDQKGDVKAEFAVVVKPYEGNRMQVDVMSIGYGKGSSYRRWAPAGIELSYTAADYWPGYYKADKADQANEPMKTGEPAESAEPAKPAKVIGGPANVGMSGPDEELEHEYSDFYDHDYEDWDDDGYCDVCDWYDEMDYYGDYPESEENSELSQFLRKFGRGIKLREAVKLEPSAKFTFKASDIAKVYVVKPSIAAPVAPVLFGLIGLQYQRGGAEAAQTPGQPCSSHASESDGGTATGQRGSLAGAIDKVGLAAGMTLLTSQAKGEIEGQKATFITDMPVSRFVLKSKFNNKDKKNLVIIVTPVIVEPTEL